MSPPPHLADLRDVRVRAQSILKRIDLFEDALQSRQANTRLQEFNASFLDEVQRHQGDVQIVERRLVSARTSMEALPESREDSGDRLSEIELQWEQVAAAWPSAAAAGFQEVELLDTKQRLRSVRRHLNELVFQVGKATIPYRLERWIEDVRIGGQLDFAAEFSDELPRARDRRRLLEFMAAAPAASSGLIDIPSARIYRISTKRSRQLASYAAFAVIAVMGAVLIWVLASFGPRWGVPDWPFTDAAYLLRGYAFVLVGAVLHIVVDALKQERQAMGAKSLLAIDDLWLWGHVKERSIAISMMALVAVTVGLAATRVELTFVTAIFAGYSADSILDLVLKRFDTYSSAQIARVEEALAVPKSELRESDDE